MSISTNSKAIENTTHELFSVIKSIDSNKRKIFHCFIKSNYYEKPLYSEFFYTVQNLRIQLEKDKMNSISIANPVDDFNQYKFQKCKDIILYVFRNSKIKITIFNNLIMDVTQDQVPLILKENHDLPTSGHCGFHRMINRIRAKYKWKGMLNDVKNYIKQCQSCQINKTSRITYKSPMEITSTSSKPFEKLSMDIVGPLPLTEDGHKYILTMQDDLTKFSNAIPISNREADTIADEFVRFISMFGIPQSILTDQGSNFTSNLMKEVSKLLKIKQIFTTAYHPQSNGALERSHSTLNDYLKHYINDQQTDWNKYIPLAMFTYNSHVHASTKFTPFELLFGYKPVIPSSISSSPEFRYTYDSYCDQLKYRLNKSHDIAKENLINSKNKSKENYDNKIQNPEYKVNDSVFLENNQSKVGQSKKLTANYKGPYKISKIHNNQNATIKIKNKFVRVHFNRLKPAISVSDS